MAKKGGFQPGGGRPKGLPNKSNARAREAIAVFVDGNIARMEGWLDAIERENGALEAFKAYTALLEYHVPKLARSEITGKDGEDLVPPKFDASGMSDEALAEIMKARRGDG